MLSSRHPTPRPDSLSRRSPVRTLRGFTLIELLVVIAIIGILAAILIPVVGKARQNSYSVRCSTNLRTIYSWLTIYAGENKGAYPAAFGPSPRYPNSTQYWTELQFYMESSRSANVSAEAGTDLRFWYCPAAANTFPEEPHRVYPINCYGRAQASGIRPVACSMPARTLLIGDGAHNTGGSSLVYFRDSQASATERATTVLEARHLAKVNGLYLDGHISPFALNDPQLDTWITNLAR
ncbi:prepilin-type N-terminal cleavage/methylation domain-containing protein [Rariglobus hedericola]|uniref:Prepilin-type N-terminal cleavage/methylation domain-containing protein n=2 Tax=Rariglobus hedericola TaxID=2597822 RepID=A0A556QLL0_9BACT|nr:prepilin-type N-terminal cleavage/methylation domain-containing protein [Rariglobus hedericola]